MTKPIIAITLGDPAGVGPEIIVKSLNHSEVYDTCRPIVIGDAKRLTKAAKLLGSSLRISVVSDPESAQYNFGTMDVIEVGNVPEELSFGVLSAEGGDAAYRYVEKAAKLALEGRVDVICTAPLNKEALYAAGHHFPGHTELLAHLS